MFRRGRPILRTAAIVGTASAVGGAVSHHQQQKYAAQDAEAQQQQYAEQAPQQPAAAPAQPDITDRAHAARAAALAGDPHRRGVLRQEGATARDLRTVPPLTGTETRSRQRRDRRCLGRCCPGSDASADDLGLHGRELGVVDDALRLEVGEAGELVRRARRRCRPPAGCRRAAPRPGPAPPPSRARSSCDHARSGTRTHRSTGSG